MNNYMYEKLKNHIGHNVVCVAYGDIENPTDICIECEDCGCVLVSAEDYDNTIKEMKRVDIVMEALDVEIEDAKKIIEHLKKHDCLEWIDKYGENDKDKEPLADIHCEDSFEEMIDWQYEDYSPSEILGVSSNIEDHKCMLELEDCVIFWYALV